MKKKLIMALATGFVMGFSTLAVAETVYTDPVQQETRHFTDDITITADPGFSFSLNPGLGYIGTGTQGTMTIDPGKTVTVNITGTTSGDSYRNPGIGVMSNGNANDSITLGEVHVTAHTGGLFAGSGGRLTIGDNSTIVTTGSIADLDGYTTPGGDGNGIDITDSSSVTAGNHLQITLSGNGNTMVRARGQSAERPATLVVGSDAVFASSGTDSGGLSANKGNITIGDRLNLSTMGDNSWGMVNYGDGVISIADALTLRTSGTSALGVVTGKATAQIVIGKQADIQTTGKEAYGIYASTGTVSLQQGGRITMQGEDAIAVLAQGGSITLGSGSHIQTQGGERAYAIVADDNGKVTVQGDALIQSKSPEAYTMLAQNNGSITGDGKLHITGEVHAIKEGSIDLTMWDGSVFHGSTAYAENSEIAISQLPGADWKVTGDSGVTRFTAGGNTYLGTDGAHFAALTRDTNDFTPVKLLIDNLSGTGGKFYLRADIDGDKADTVFITNGAGSHKLVVRSHGAEPSSEAMAAYLVHQEAGSATFALGNPGELVDTGLYIYELAQRKANDASGEAVADEWHLKRTTRPVEPDPDKPKPGKPILSPTGEAEAALSGIAGNYALWYGQLTNLRKRLGEVRYGTQTGLWVRGFADKTRMDGFGDASFTQNTYGGSIGYDKIMTEDKTYLWFLGAQLRTAHADQHVNGRWGGKGDLSSLGAGLYSTWAHADGWYVDAVATYDHYKHKIRTSMLDGVSVSDDRSAYGLGASLEAGRRIAFGHSNEERDYWFVEPQLQLSYFWLKGGDFTASNGMTIDQRNMDSLTGHAGVVLGKKFAMGADPDAPQYVQPYLKAGINHEFLGDQVTHINGTRMHSDLAGTRFYYGAGVDWQIADNLRLYMQTEREQGKHFTREVNVSAGLKWGF